MSNINLNYLLIILVICCSCSEYSQKRKTDIEPKHYTINIPTMGNSWLINNVYQSSGLITEDGIQNWTSTDQIFRTYFYVQEIGKISLGLKAKVKSGETVVKVSFNGETKEIKISNTEFESIYIGNLVADKIGYYYVEFQGVKKDDLEFGQVTDLLIATDTNAVIKYIKDDFYFGRRGPSVHLRYPIPQEVKEVEWFYNEIEIPEGQDAIGSYFMANGFKEGYYGIQVNSETERRILFSIWSPYKTDDPNSIPEDYRINLLKKGDGVISGKFGDEGSGGQSYKVYNWESGVRYKFLTHVKPSVNNSTDYTSYFFDPKVGEWTLIASFRRPKTTTYLKNLYSFLENFIPNTGVIDRKGGFYNQWIADSKGNWTELTEIEFTADNTARKENRFDYSGGVENGGFYLRNCGFTNHITKIGTYFNREKLNQQPNIDFKSLQ